MSSETNCITPSDQPITLLAPPCTQLFGPDCVIEILYSEPSKIEPSLEHRFLRCSRCGTEASATAERKDWCAPCRRGRMLIDGQFIPISDEQCRKGREQLELPTGFVLVEATRLLQHDTGTGLVQIPLPIGFLVVAYENPEGYRRYGVVCFEDLKSSR